MAKIQLVNPKDPKKLPVGFKRKWIKALRSGKYRQGRKTLYTKGSHRGRPRYCCLGVAGRICGLSNEDMRRKGFVYNCGVIPDLITGDDGIATVLSGMNDRHEKSFSKIADWIQENL